MCIVYELGRQPPARREVKGELHGKIRVPGRGREKDRQRLGEPTTRSPGYKAGIAAVLANSANVTAHGGTPAHDSDGDTFSATLKCHAANNEIFLVTFGREQVSVSSYEDDAILTVIETWADGVTALA